MTIIASIFSRLWARVAPYLTAILVAFVLMFGGVAAYQTVRIEGFSLGPIKIKGFEEKLKDTRAKATGLQQALDRSETLREQEREQNRASYRSLQQRCTQRVRRAVNSARIIKEIIHAPLASEPDPSLPADAPVNRPRIIDAGRLRAIIGQPPLDPAPVVSAGTDDGGRGGTPDTGSGGDTPATDPGREWGVGSVPDVDV